MKKTTILASVALVGIFCGIFAIAYKEKNKNEVKVTAKSVTYICKDNKRIGAKYIIPVNEQTLAEDGNLPVPQGSVFVTLSDGRSLELKQTISGSGVRYANTDESFIFWSKGTGVMILEDNEEKNFFDCEEIISSPTLSTSTKKVLYDNELFSLLLPRYTTPPQLARTDSYQVNESYAYNTIKGVQFTIPQSLASGTNLSKDSYISVERLQATKKCDARYFFDHDVTSTIITEGGDHYSIASSTDAAAGNRYEHIVFAKEESGVCFGIRYSIHSTVFENYPPNTIRPFNRNELIKEFDAIRASLTIK